MRPYDTTVSISLGIVLTHAFLTLVYQYGSLYRLMLLVQREGHKVAVATTMIRSERKELKSAPGGFVIARRMTYGEKLMRGEMSGKMRILSNKVDKDAVGEMNMLQKSVQLWEFSNLIIEHNLEHQIHTGDPVCYKGECACPTRTLNFKNTGDVELLDGRVGEEIQMFLDSLNNFEEEDETKNSSSGSEQA